MKALAVVAHSDDHILWMGGTIARLKHWTWHILALCKSHNGEDFEPKRTVFHQSCKQLGVVKYSARDLKDYQPREAMECQQLARMKEEILAFADDTYDLVFTHSIHNNCEYGFHANHVEVRDAVNQLVERSMITTGGVLYFSYKSGGCKRPVRADLDSANYKIELGSAEVAAKTKLKRLFIWAEADLKSLSLWDNDEPKIEAFQGRTPQVELASDFVGVRAERHT
jgi:LmbE family N-acetylglucosaminyl deacetylase